jgi:SAM-dependent methyltransferase
MPDPARPEQKGHRWFATFYDLQMRATERKLGPRRGRLLAGLRGDVLEIGAGTGSNFAHYPPEAHVIALEPDPFMAARARRKLAAGAHPNIEVREEPAELLPFADASFDAVVATLVLCTVGDVTRSLAEIRRVLRPGGELRFFEHVRADGMLGRVQDLMQPAWGWCSAGCHANRRTEDALRAAGFEVAPVERLKLAPWLPAIFGVARAPGAPARP